jgi:hypothetical protein
VVAPIVDLDLVPQLGRAIPVALWHSSLRRHAVNLT